ncbi:MAG: hypothetical protein FWC70_07735 [Defluviitaleaceae bacterium]|nr:hypothetical protein [Defluviitaleaceae bacterium]
MQTPTATPFAGLNQWDAQDPLRTSQFSEDNYLIDEALRRLSEQIAQRPGGGTDMLDLRGDPIVVTNFDDFKDPIHTAVSFDRAVVQGLPPTAMIGVNKGILSVMQADEFTIQTLKIISMFTDRAEEWWRTYPFDGGFSRWFQKDNVWLSGHAGPPPVAVGATLFGQHELFQGISGTNGFDVLLEFILSLPDGERPAFATGSPTFGFDYISRDVDVFGAVREMIMRGMLGTLQFNRANNVFSFRILPPTGNWEAVAGTFELAASGMLGCAYFRVFGADAPISWEDALARRASLTNAVNVEHFNLSPNLSFRRVG